MKSSSFLQFTMALLFLTTTTTPKRTSAGDPTINLVTVGAKPGRSIDSSTAFNRAWAEACKSMGPSTIYVPQGDYLVSSPVIFDGNKCKSRGVSFVIEGTLVGPADFEVLGNSGYWFLFNHTTGVSLSGGVFNGQGQSLWACKMSPKSCPPGATTLRFNNSMNVVINGVTSLNSQLYHIVIDECKNVKVQGVKVFASNLSLNTDGIHIQKSTGVTILSSNIGTGDDCVSIGVGTNNSWIENMACGPGHGISIGSLGKLQNEPGVQNVTIKNVTFTDTLNGVRIKSWGKPSNGYVRDVVFQHLIMVNAQNPIIIDQNYCPNVKKCPRQVSGVRISGITYQDIHGSSATPIAIKFDCSSKQHCTHIKLDDINLTYKNQEAQSSCVNVVGSTYGLIEPKSCF